MRKVKPSVSSTSIDSMLNASRSPREQETEYNDYSFDNFSSSELKVKSSFYNELEARWISERKQAKRNNSGRSVSSIKKSPYKRSIDLLGSSDISIITDNVLLGSRENAGDIKLLNKLGVTHILNVAQQVPNFYPTNFVYLKIPLLDAAEVNAVECMQSVVLFLRHVEEINGRVLIHCISGVSRSVVVLLMYFIIHHKMPLKNIYGYVRSCRAHIAPNEGFKMQLIQVEINRLGYSSVAKDKDKVWDFYEFNNIRRSVATERPDPEDEYEDGICCVVS